ncbi:TonB family protein, partial [Pseudomonas syringae]|nr:TonB family protein [Pseudomonas syringae]
APVEELPIPKLAEAPKAEIAVPKPKPKPPKPKPPKPVEKKLPDPPKEKPSEEKPADTPPTPAPTEKSAQPAPGPSPAQQAAKASWQGTLLAHLSKYKKYPRSAQSRGKEGLNRLRFVVDGEGNVLSFELVGRSGNADLDRATLEMIRRAQPLPKPPADMLTNGSIEIVAPFVYSLERRR